MMELCWGGCVAVCSMRGGALVWLYCLDSSKGICWCWEKTGWWKFSSRCREVCTAGLSSCPHWRRTGGLGHKHTQIVNTYSAYVYELKMMMAGPPHLLLRCRGVMQGSPMTLLWFKGAVDGHLLTATSHGRICDVVRTSHTCLGWGDQKCKRHLCLTASDCRNSVWNKKYGFCELNGDLRKSAEPFVDITC